MMLLEFVQGLFLRSIFPTQPGIGLCHFHASVLLMGTSKEEKAPAISGHKIFPCLHIKLFLWQLIKPEGIKNIPHKTAAGIKTA